MMIRIYKCFSCGNKLETHEQLIDHSCPSCNDKLELTEIKEEKPIQ